MRNLGLGDLGFLAAVSGERDPFFANVSLLLHGDGANNSTSIIDTSLSPRTVTVISNTKISTAQSKFGGSSIYFDGDSDYLSLDGSSQFAFGTDDFTIEFFYYPLTAGSGAGYAAVYSFRASGEGLSSRLDCFHNATSPNLLFQQGSSGLATSGMTFNAWHHLAISKSGTALRLFLNGAQQGATVTESANFGVGANRPVIGANVNQAATLNGYIDELRITKGVARYTANFTPPTAPFPDA